MRQACLYCQSCDNVFGLLSEVLSVVVSVVYVDVAFLQIWSWLQGVFQKKCNRRFVIREGKFLQLQFTVHFSGCPFSALQKTT